jgi:hypothetical protein
MIGDKKGLTAQYSDYVRLLSRELGIRPSEELIRFLRFARERARRREMKYVR